MLKGPIVVGGYGSSGKGRGSKALNCVNICGVPLLRGPWRVICSARGVGRMHLAVIARIAAVAHANIRLPCTAQDVWLIFALALLCINV